jgi:chromosomal replication initiation ATPase DnaA
MSSAPRAAKAPSQLAFELGHQASLAIDDFIVGDGNRLALGHILTFPEWPGPLTVLVGAAKSGKSHLARIFADRSGAGFGSPRTLERLAARGGVKPLVIEDVDRAGYAEAALFHLLNQSMRDSRPVLMTARTPTSAWPYATDDLKSRARLAQHFDVSVSSDIQLSQMFVKLFHDRQVAVDPKVVAYLVQRMERSPEEAVALADLADGLALRRGTGITRAIAAEALALRMRPDASQLMLDLEGGEDE